MAHPNHLTVTGIRGKSSTVKFLERILRGRGYRTLAKVTGDEPLWIRQGEVIPIKRKPYTPVDLHETLGYRRFEYDVFVAENQGIHPHTMRAFQEIVRPHTTLITNVRLDHTDAMGRTHCDIAASLGRGIGRWPRAVLSAEPAPGLNAIIQRELFRGQWFRSIADTITVNGSYQLPMLAYLEPLLDQTLEVLGEPALTPIEWDLLREGVKERFQLQPGSFGGDYFDGAKINDLDSAWETWNYLTAEHPAREWSVLAYFRHDRIERTEFFIPWLEGIASYGRVRAIHLVGFGAPTVARRLGSAKVYVWPDAHQSINEVFRAVEGSALYLACNAVNPFMRAVRARLAGAPAQSKQGVA